MADVQLERGYLRIANRLEEALLIADFTLTQHKIIRCLIRLTWGWKQHTVRISASDIADKCGLRDSGGFRRELRALIANHVIEEVEAARGRAASVYRIQKDFEDWGLYSVSAKKLEALFGERLPSLNSTRHRVRPIVNDGSRSVTPQGQSTDDDFDEEDDASVTPQGQSTDPRSMTPQGHESQLESYNLAGSVEQAIRLSGVTHLSRKSLKPETYEPSKDKKNNIPSSSTDHITGAGIARARGHAHTNSDAPPTATAVQRFLDARRPETRSDWRAELAALEMKYSPALVERVALDCLMADDPPSTPGVFKIFCAATVADGTAPAVPNGKPPPLAIVRADAAEAERAEREEYDLERRAAGQAWARNPANEFAWRLLMGEAETELGAAVGYPGGPRFVEQSAMLKAAAVAGFPEFDAWRWSHGRTRGTR